MFLKKLENDNFNMKIGARDKELLMICSNYEEIKAMQDLENAIAIDLGMKKFKRISNKGNEKAVILDEK